MPVLVADVAAVLEDLGVERAIVIGHDWRGAIAWNLAMTRPELVEKLVVLNLPHPRSLLRELSQNPKQQQASQYARDFQKEGAHRGLTAENLASWVREPKARERYVEAFRRSSFEAMLNYYKASYPRESYDSPFDPFPPVRASTLLIHGLQDRFRLSAGLNQTWEWLLADLTLVTIPGAGHFVHQDAGELVTRSLQMWLNR